MFVGCEVVFLICGCELRVVFFSDGMIGVRGMGGMWEIVFYEGLDLCVVEFERGVRGCGRGVCGWCDWGLVSGWCLFCDVCIEDGFVYVCLGMVFWCGVWEILG